jgi:hypothetical protein
MYMFAEFIKMDVCRRLLSQATLLTVLDRHRLDADFLAKFRHMYGSAPDGNLTFLRDSIQNPSVREGCAARHQPEAHLRLKADLTENRGEGRGGEEKRRT